MKLALIVLFSSALISLLSWFYSPSLELTILSSAVAIFLAALLLWSASKLATGRNFVLKVAVVALAAGFMYSQAMDIGYSALSAPAGGRFTFFVEIAAVAGVLVAIALLGRLLLFRPEKKEQANG